MRTLGKQVLVSLSVILTLRGSACSSVAEIQTKHVVEKDNLLLVCNTTELPEFDEFYWVRNYSIHGQETSGFYRSGWRLEFIGIDRESSTGYSCHATNNRTGENVILASFMVDVQYPTKIRYMYLSPKIINAGDWYESGCGMDGNPAPMWTFRNIDTQRVSYFGTASNGLGTLGNNAICGDTGMWECTGRNWLNRGVNVTRKQHLTVFCPPSIDFNKKLVYDYTASLGSNVSMMIEFVGDPVPTLLWSRSDNRTLGDVDIEESVRNTTLTIFDVGASDFGHYMLKMSSPNGSYIARLSLRAYGYPEKPYNIRISNVTHSHVDLTWTSGFDSGTTQRFQIRKWTGNEFVSISPPISGPYASGGVDKNWSYHLAGLQPDTYYNLSIRAVNAENITYSDPVVFKTLSSDDSLGETMRKVAIGSFVLSGLLFTWLIIEFLTNVCKRFGKMQPKGESDGNCKTPDKTAFVVTDNMKIDSNQEYNPENKTNIQFI